MNIYTRTGDDGTTGLLHGGRTAKDAPGPEAYGTVDEAVSALGVARAVAADETAERILEVQQELFVVGAELATTPDRRSRLKEGVSLVTGEMIARLESEIDGIVEDRGLPSEFVVPGGSPLSAALDHARAVVRRAERNTVAHLRESGITDSLAVPYLNRLADYVYVLARATEGAWLPSRREE
jgi:cob(I)alamin adenosyltransferase